MNIEEIETPAAVVDLDRLERNIAALQKKLNGLGLKNWPHIKTHRIPEIALMQVRAGAAGVTCQKLAEAEIMADAGIEDIFLPYNILGTAKLKRLVDLARRVRLSVSADSAATVDGLAAAFAGAPGPLEVLVEFDTGLGRCGVQTPEEARLLARKISASPGLKFGGLMTHPHNAQSDPFVEEAAAALMKDGIEVDRVSYGGTPELVQAGSRARATEYRAGSYVYGDRAILRSGAMKPEDCALRVLSTVVSKPTSTRGILDAGSKALSSDLLGFKDYGTVLEYPRALIHGLSEEHGWVDFSGGERAPEVGERVSILANHCCVVSNLFAKVSGFRKGRVEVEWEVAARGTP